MDRFEHPCLCLARDQLPDQIATGIDNDDFEDTPEDFIARIIVPKARSNLNCCVLSEQRMAKRPPLSTGTVKRKRFDFALDDDDFEEHTRGFVPHE